VTDTQPTSKTRLFKTKTKRWKSPILTRGV